MSGSVDGQGEFRGDPFAGSGSAGYPDAAAVLRSYLGHPALEVLFAADELDRVGAVVVGLPRPYRDVLPVRMKTATGMRHTGMSHCDQAGKEASAMGAKHPLDESDARAGALLYRVASELEPDLVITRPPWRLARAGRPPDR